VGFVPRRNGGRHPDPSGAVSLRGLAEEHGSWSVRHAFMGLVPRLAVAPMTTGVLWSLPRRGTSSASAKRAHSTWQEPNKLLHLRGHVLRSVQRPVHVNLHSGRLESLSGRKPCEVERSIRYRGRATPRKWEEPAPGPDRTDDCAARRVAPLSESTPRGRACRVRKGRWSWPSSLRGNESPEPSARTSETLQETGRQHPGLE
jgi:hypothetical protein